MYACVHARIYVHEVFGFLVLCGANSFRFKCSNVIWVGGSRGCRSANPSVAGPPAHDDIFTDSGIGIFACGPREDRAAEGCERSRRRAPIFVCVEDVGRVGSNGAAFGFINVGNCKWYGPNVPHQHSGETEAVESRRRSRARRAMFHNGWG